MPDEDNWLMNPLHEVIGWLYDILEKLDWKMTPLEVLRTEKEYPGLISDIAVEAWQRRLVREQMLGAAKEKEPYYD